MKRSAFELGQAKAPLGKKVNTDRGNLYATLKDYPGRTVPLSTAYQRMIARPDLSMHEACTLIDLSRLPKPKKRLSDRLDPEYIAELKTKARYTDLAKKWGLNPSTVLKHRQKLKEEAE